MARTNTVQPRNDPLVLARYRPATANRVERRLGGRQNHDLLGQEETSAWDLKLVSRAAGEFLVEQIGIVLAANLGCAL